MNNNVDSEILKPLETAWHQLAGPYHCHATRSAFFEGIVNRYSEEGRFYHTLRHVGDMLDSIESYRDRLADYESVAFAAWFHDIIFDTHAGDNEERSATLAARTLRRLQVPSRISNRARELILMTASHLPSDSSFDARLFLDVDLAIFGAEPERYAEYSRDIRREYSWLADAEYRTGRADVLGRFLERDRIFLTDEFHERCEAQARQNIAAEMTMLQEPR